MMDIFSRPAPSADKRIAYGAGKSQFGDLWLPKPEGQSQVPVVVFFHGGWWKSKYDLAYANHLCAALRLEGVAVWSVEYRRVGATGGGWPATFLDAAAGFNFVVTLAKTYSLDLSRVITMGHSAGGHLAFWIAGRHHIDSQAGSRSELLPQRPLVPLIGAIALAGAVDLRLLIDLSGDSAFAHDKEEVCNLMGGGPADLPARYRAGNPGDLLPFQIPQVVIQGVEDDQIPPDLPRRWVERAHAAGDGASSVMIPAADHFDVVDPQSKAWDVVRHAVREMIFAAPHKG